VGLALSLVLVKGWAVGLIKADYCALCGALISGLYLARRMADLPAQAKLLSAGVGLGVGLWIPAAAWKLAPGLGFVTGPFSVWPQTLMGAGCGLAGAWLAGRRARRPSLAEEVERRRLERQKRDLE